MAYLINKFNGEQLVILQDGTTDTSTSLTLVGRNSVGYGEIQNENFVFLLENFANQSPPNRPISGQIWYDSSNKILKVYNGNSWKNTGSAEISQTAPESPSLGSLWLKTTDNTLNVYDGIEWQFIGPDGLEDFGATRTRAKIYRGEDGIDYPVVEIIVDDTVIAVVSRSDFNVNITFRPSGFPVLIRKGINLSTDVVIQGGRVVNAEQADILSVPRRINGIGFNGSQDITVRASTTNRLIAGNYVNGVDFDGSQAATWSIEATPSNVPGRIVARNTAGDFSAGTITADLVGDVIGNVSISTGESNFNIVRANEFIGATLSGNAFSATKLANTRSINGVNFDGTRDITVTADARTLSNTELNPTVIFSSLQTVGKLIRARVENTIGIGTSEAADDLVLTSNSITAKNSLFFNVGDSGLIFYKSFDAVSLAIGSNDTIIPKTGTTVDLGQTGHEFNSIHADTFVGSLNGTASMASVSSIANNLAGGGAGFIPYQTGSNVTSYITPGVTGQILKMGGANTPLWDNLTFARLNSGAYINGADYNGNTEITWDVDATSANTANKIVARDASGNFAAGTITANLTGNVTGNLVGNASTVTNGVYTTGTYNDPTWITSLSGTKVTAIPNASLVNSTITINSTPVSLGGSYTLPQGFADNYQWSAAAKSPFNTYTNSTGKTIFVNCTVNGLSYGAYSIATVGSVEVARDRDNGSAGDTVVALNLGFFVPNGATYRVEVFSRTGALQTGATVIAWAEFQPS